MSRFDIKQPEIKQSRFNTGITSTKIPTTLSYPKPGEPSLAGLPYIEGGGADTPLGVAYNTIVGIPKAGVDIVKDIGQGVARSVASVGITAANRAAENFNKPKQFEEEIPTTGNPVTEAVFGGKPIRSVPKQIEKTQEFLKPYIGETGSKYTAAPLVLGSIALDLSGWGGGKAVNVLKDEVPEQFLKYLAKEKNPQVIEDTLKNVGLDELNSKVLAPKLAETKTTGEVKDILINHELPKTELPIPKAEPTTPSLFETTPKVEQPTPSIFSKEAPVIESATPLEKSQQVLEQASKTATSPESVSALEPLNNIIERKVTDVKNRANALDYLRTPKYVLKKFGLEKNANELETAYDNYLQELPKNIDQITSWSKQVAPEANQKIFKWLDGDKEVILAPNELKVANEIKTWLSGWADRLGLKPDERVSYYITHIFPPGKGGELNEEIAKMIQYSVPGSVYDPYLLSRTGVKGYIEDTWKALDAYVKTATRKVYMDPALEKLKSASNALELSQMNYIKRYADRINMRPTELDTLIDNGIKSVAGYKLGVRPVKNITSTARKIVSRAKLGLSFTSAFKNLTQGVNTFSELGTRYTLKGYTDLLTKGTKELNDVGVLRQSFIEDRTYSAIKKFWEKADKLTFWNFQATEAINRGAAYYGAKAQYLNGDAPIKEIEIALGRKPIKNENLTIEDAQQYAKYIAGKTQFLFGSIDTPVALGSDIAKTLSQFQTFTLKEMEFLGEKLKNKEYASLARYVAASAIVFGVIGSAFGMSFWDILPGLRFGTPPTLDLPVRTFKNIIGAKNQYGQTPTGKARLRDEINAILTDVVPGGTQINRSIGGLKSVLQGKSTTSSGNFQYRINKTPENLIRGILFGKSNLPESKKYYNKKSSPKKIKTSRFNTY